MKNRKLSEHANRLDVEMQKRGLVRSRSQATDLIKRKKVFLDGKLVTKSGVLINSASKISMDSSLSFVSRAGEKLEHALNAFGIDPIGCEVIDIGSSTGGFTECLLSHGAAKVIAIDVGTDQLDPKLRIDVRVEVHEKTDVRQFVPARKVSLVTIDVSFISLTLILPKAFEFLVSGGDAIALIKPQFEVGAEIARKTKGVISDKKLHDAVIRNIKESVSTLGFKIVAETVSPISGEKGNSEFFIHLKK
jgi:23S rRNA (cytidine1920-2'-O)/16S rRNA (cytidine1409-2'-O)-methyltransferase